MRHRAPGDNHARAYGGPAHGEQWVVDPAEPPSWVELPTGASSCLYRLVRHPRSGRPARDHLGSLRYVPLTGGVPTSGPPDTAQVLAFPGTGPTGWRSRLAARHTWRAEREGRASRASTGSADVAPPLDDDVPR